MCVCVCGGEDLPNSELPPNLKIGTFEGGGGGGAFLPRCLGFLYYKFSLSSITSGDPDYIPI